MTITRNEKIEAARNEFSSLARVSSKAFDLALDLLPKHNLVIVEAEPSVDEVEAAYISMFGKSPSPHLEVHRTKLVRAALLASRSVSTRRDG